MCRFELILFFYIIASITVFILVPPLLPRHTELLRISIAFLSISAPFVPELEADEAKIKD